MQKNKINRLFTIFFALLALLVPIAANAVHNSVEFGTDVSTLASSPTLWLAVVIGTTVAVFSVYFSVQMAGSTIGSAMKFFGIGMLLITSGFISVIFKWSSLDIEKYVHDGVFIVGCLCCLWGIFKIRKLSQ